MNKSKKTGFFRTVNRSPERFFRQTGTRSGEKNIRTTPLLKIVYKFTTELVELLKKVLL